MVLRLLLVLVLVLLKVLVLLLVLDGSILNRRPEPFTPPPTHPFHYEYRRAKYELRGWSTIIFRDRVRPPEPTQEG